MAWTLYHSSVPSGNVSAVAAGQVLFDNWTDQLGSIWSVASSALQAAAGGTYATKHLTRPTGENQADARIVVTCNPASVAGDYIIILRRADASNFYVVQMTLVAGAGSSTIKLYKYVAGSLTALGTSQFFTGVAGHTYTLDGSILGTTLAATVIDTTASTTLVNNYTQTDSALSAAGQYALSSASTNTAITQIDLYNQVTTSFTVRGPNSATTLPSNHNGNISLSLVGTGTSWAAQTFTISGVTGWSKVSQTIVDTTHVTLVVAPPAAASPPAGTTGTLTVTDGTLNSTITIGTPSFTISPSTAIPSAGATTLTFTGTNTLWQGDNPQFTMSALSGSSLGASTATTNSASTATMTVGSTTGTTTITDPSTGATQTFQVTNAAPGTVADLNVFFSPYNWYSAGGGALQSNGIRGGSTYAISNTPGAYVKFKFTGTGVTLNYDSSAYSAAGDYPIITYSIDGGPITTYQLASGDAGAKILATGLTDTLHSVVLRFKSTGVTTSNDRWNWSAAPYAVLRINSFTFTGAAPSTTAMTLRTKRAIFFGDSIEEGLHAAQGDTTTADAFSTFVPRVAEALDCEYGVIAFNGQAWTNTAAGNVPTFHTIGTAASQAWQWYASGKSRLVSSAFSPAPDYVISAGMGTNDGLAGASNASVTAAINDWLTTMHSTTAPLAKIFLVLPAGRWKKTAFAAVTLPALCYYIDLDASTPADQRLATGLTNNDAGDGTAASAASARSADGLHPNSLAQAEIGARTTQAIMNILQPPGAGGFRRTVMTGGMTG